MINLLKTALIFFLLWIVSGCRPSDETKVVSANINSQVVKPKYAQFFEIEENSKNRKLRIFNPWKKGAVLQEIILGPEDPTKKISGIHVKTPVNSVIPMSTSFYGYMELLGKLETISAVENKDFVFNKLLLNRIAAGELPEIGQAGNISVERTVVLNPDVIIISGTEIMGPNLLKITEAGIPVLNNMDWQEQHPLGRAEWIKVFGVLLDQEQLADSLFNDIEQKYLALKTKVNNLLPSQKPDVLLGYNYQGTWFLPGGQSYVAQYLRDAGVNYQYNSDSSTGSLPLSCELVFNDFKGADYWLNPGACKNKTELKMLDKRYEKLTSFVTSNVYNNTRRSLPTGGNDFWESSPSHPHWVLADLVKIFHPALLPDHKLYFYQRLE